MPDERFNNLIKKKLESVQPPYKEEAWKNFNKLLPAPWYVNVFHQYRNWIYGGIGGVVVTVISILYFQQNQENQQLHETIATLKKEVTEQYNKQKPAADKESVIIADSIRKNAETNQIQTPTAGTVFHVNKETANPVKNSNNQDIEQEKQNQSLKIPTPEKNISATTVNRSAENKRKASSFGRDEAGKQKPSGNIASINRNKTVSDNVDLNQVDSVLTDNNSRNKTLPDLTKTERANSVIKTDSAKQKQSQNLALARQDTTSAGNNMTPDSASVNNSKELPKAERKLQFSGLQARVGVNLNLGGLNKLAFGPNIELLIGQHWSIGAGLNISRPEEERHHDTHAFNLAKGKRFEDMYHVWLRPDDKIEEIDLKTTVLQLPLSVNYYLPIKGKFSLLFTGGTTLDLTVNQQVNFERTPPGGGAERYKFNADPHTYTINNVLYGMGIQYQNKRVVGQITPYYIYQFVNPEYYNPASKIGVNASLKFNLRRAGN
ncbi:MAG: hypothetical protein COW65_16365 [Cytophagales bacterium CG18_big_fil_WC_8_21_14_2_50_42_9]|nr:MAG: hypothetical protein COW65_16365 [Cytophagales bacterium CG18_big_fil_WC_8_21_14_2_50_42_9]